MHSLVYISPGEKGHFARSKLCKYYSETSTVFSISDKMQDNDRLHTNEMSNNNCDMVNVFSETEDVSVFAVDMPGNELNNDWNVQMYVKNSPLKMEIDTIASSTS